MNQSKYIFAQLTAFLIKRVFDGTRYVTPFTCLHQHPCVVFGQFCNRKSLRDLVVGPGAYGQKSITWAEENRERRRAEERP